jgi:NTE family protein
VLLGGGARAAYQVGVLKGIAQILPRRAPNPFPVVTGVSAGAVSALALAADSAHYRRAVHSLERVWREFRVAQVFRADAASMFQAGLHWLAALASGGLVAQAPHALFDNAPLWQLLGERLEFDRIPRGLAHGSLRAVGIAATSYEDGESVTYYDTVAGVEPWRRAYRRGVRTPIALDHVMASLAIPFLFRPVRLADGYYGDGAMRQTSPLGSAVHLGAERLLVIGVAERRRETVATQAPPPEPSYGRMFGFMLDSLFTDHVDVDIERIALHNRAPGVRAIESMIIRPSRPLLPIAHRHIARLPRSLRVLLRTIGAGGAAGTQLMSYLMFESAFTRDLIALGVADALARADQLSRFLGFDSGSATASRR